MNKILFRWLRIRTICSFTVASTTICAVTRAGFNFLLLNPAIVTAQIVVDATVNEQIVRILGRRKSILFIQLAISIAEKPCLKTLQTYTTSYFIFYLNHVIALKTSSCTTGLPAIGEEFNAGITISGTAAAILFKQKTREKYFLHFVGRVVHREMLFQVFPEIKVCYLQYFCFLVSPIKPPFQNTKKILEISIS